MAAEVYLSEHIFLKTLAALKILRAPLLEQAIPACLREARTLASLTHPNIVRVLDFGVQDETFFLAMEYVPGDTLQQSYPSGSHLSPASMVSLIKPIASALQYAHDQNIIHGSVKPENILLGTGTEVLLSDFGILTLLQIIGSYQTPPSIYTAPEQFDGPPQPASDQYSLAVIAYELLNGERPFQDDTARLNGNMPDIDEVLHTAMEKDPTRRFSSIQAFARALEQACSNSLAEASSTITAENTLRPTTVTRFPNMLEAQPPLWSQEAASSTFISSGSVPPLPITDESSSTGYPSSPVLPRKNRNRTTLGIILLILALVVGGATSTVFAVGPKRMLQIITGGRTTPQPTAEGLSAAHPPLVSPTSLAPTPIPTFLPTPTPVPTSTPVPTPTPEQQAQSVIENYYTAINNKNYQAAYNLWVNYQGSYQSFVNGFANSAHDDYQFGTIMQQSDGTVQVPITLTATSTSSQQTTYQGYYIVAQQPDGTWKIVSASMAEE